MAGILANIAGRYPFAADGNDIGGGGFHLTTTGAPTFGGGRFGAGCSPTSAAYFTYTNPTHLNGKRKWAWRFSVRDSAYVINEALGSIGTGANAGSIIAYPYDTATGNGLKMFANNVLGVFDLNDGSPALNVWSDVLIIVNADDTPSPTARLWINGVLKATNTTDNFVLNAALTHFSIGRYPNAAQSYTGETAHHFLWTDRVFDAAEIAAINAWAGEPINISLPTITGLAKVGEVVTLANGTWDSYGAGAFSAGALLSYSNTSGGDEQLVGAMGAGTYTIASGLAGRYLRYRATYANPYGNGVAYSDYFGPIASRSRRGRRYIVILKGK